MYLYCTNTYPTPEFLHTGFCNIRYWGLCMYACLLAVFLPYCPASAFRELRYHSTPCLVLLFCHFGFIPFLRPLRPVTSLSLECAQETHRTCLVHLIPSPEWSRAGVIPFAAHRYAGMVHLMISIEVEEFII